MSIDQRAVIDPSARIADDVTIGAFSIIGPDVEIGAGTVIGPHVVINGPT
ncbi:MAG: acyl-[acyl-carrier-protein]--UDP-N-acetylglucosamine O-acyltransferase, partial [Thiohalophilus sp.]